MRRLISRTLLVAALVALSSCAVGSSSNTKRLETSGGEQSGQFSRTPGWSELPRPPVWSGSLAWAGDRAALVSISSGESPTKMWTLKPGDDHWVDTGPLPFQHPIVSPQLSMLADTELLVAGTTCSGKYDEESGCEGEMKFEFATYDVTKLRWNEAKVSGDLSAELADGRDPLRASLRGTAAGQLQVTWFKTLNISADRRLPTGSVVHLDAETGKVLLTETEAVSPADRSCYVGDVRWDLIGPPGGTEPTNSIQLRTTGSDGKDSAVLPGRFRGDPGDAELACGDKQVMIVNSLASQGPPVVVGADGSPGQLASGEDVSGFVVSKDPVLVESNPSDRLASAHLVLGDFSKNVTVPGTRFLRAAGTGTGVIVVGKDEAQEPRSFYLSPPDNGAGGSTLPPEANPTLLPLSPKPPG